MFRIMIDLVPVPSHIFRDWESQTIYRLCYVLLLAIGIILIIFLVLFSSILPHLCLNRCILFNQLAKIVVRTTTCISKGAIQLFLLHIQCRKETRKPTSFSQLALDTAPSASN